MEPLIVFFGAEQYCNPSKEINQKVIDIYRETLKLSEENEKNLKNLELKLQKVDSQNVQSMQAWTGQHLSPQLIQLNYQLMRAIEEKKFDLVNKTAIKDGRSSFNFLLRERRKGVIYAGS